MMTCMMMLLLPHHRSHMNAPTMRMVPAHQLIESIAATQMAVICIWATMLLLIMSAGAINSTSAI